MRFQTASSDRSAALRSRVFSLAKTCSMGLRSGEVVHRSAIVKAERVISVERKRWGDLALHLTTGVAVPVGKTYRDAARRLTVGGLTMV